MKFVDEYRAPRDVRALADRLSETAVHPWTIMEVCGGQTHAIVRFGIDQLLPPGITLVHGPGCPVCVTPGEVVDAAIDLAARPEVMLCSFGDMLRVPGSDRDLLAARAAGADVRMVYSPLDAVGLARTNPDRQIVFFAVGFETTAPSTALAVLQAEREKLGNFSMLVAHVLVLPAMAAVLALPESRVQGFLAAGHVCAVTGWEEYESLAARYGVPVVVTGFEPVDLMRGILRCADLLESGTPQVVNEYARAVSREGNLHARRTIEQVFEVTDRNWRGLGPIPASGLRLRETYGEFDAEKRFGIVYRPGRASETCISGRILQGIARPADCPAFGKECTPERPLGPTMVSSEGACAAYYRFRRR